MQQRSSRRHSPARMLRSTTTATTTSRPSAPACADALPVELWIEVLSRMSVKQAVAAGGACSTLASVRDASARLAGSREFGTADWGRVEGLDGLDWRAKVEAVSNYRVELASLPPSAGFGSVQTAVQPQHRAIATEWLAEVCKRARGAAGG